MNPLTNVRNITKLNEQELKLGINNSCSWHKIYKDSPWVFIGGLDYELTEGDVICVFSQYGEIEDINLIRDKKTGKSKGFCFLSYQNKTSTVLAVDNFNGIKLCGRTIRVDHVANYRPPKEGKQERKEESDEDLISSVKPTQQDSDKETKTKHKNKQHKAFSDGDDNEVLKERHFHKINKHNVQKETIVDRGKTRVLHHRARDLSEKSYQGSTSKHKDDNNSYKQWRTERKFGSSSDESIKHHKHKLKKEKHKDVKAYSSKRNPSYSSSDESNERTKHKIKHKHKKHKHKESRHKNSD